MGKINEEKDEKTVKMFYNDLDNGVNLAFYFPESNMEKVIQMLKTPDSSIGTSKKLLKRRKWTTNKIIVHDIKDE